MHQIDEQVALLARETRAALVEALGTEADAGHWMVFMQSVTRLLPDVLSSGRPTRAAIERSAIGQLGFDSWAEMVEAPLEAGGLGWNMSAWKAWRRAWAVVQAHPWMLEARLGSSEVNQLAINCRKAGEPIPGSAAQYDEIKRRREMDRESPYQRILEEMAQLKERLAAKEIEAAQSKAEAGGLDLAMSRAIDRASQAELLAAQRLEEISNLNAQVAGLKRQLMQAQAAVPPKLTRWQHLMAALFG